MFYKKKVNNIRWNSLYPFKIFIKYVFLYILKIFYIQFDFFKGTRLNRFLIQVLVRL